MIMSAFNRCQNDITATIFLPPTTTKIIIMYISNSALQPTIVKFLDPPLRPAVSQAAWFVARYCQSHHQGGSWICFGLCLHTTCRRLNKQTDEYLGQLTNGQTVHARGESACIIDDCISQLKLVREFYLQPGCFMHCVLWTSITYKLVLRSNDAQCHDYAGRYSCW